MISYNVYGRENSGDWIVLLHGIGGSSTIWYKQITLLRRKFKVMAIDLPSHGNSKDIEGKEWSIKKCVKEIREVIKKENIKRFHVMGVSLGSLLLHEWIKKDYKNMISTILVGTVLKWNWKGKILVKLAKLGKHILPIKWMYPICAYILLPRRNHKESRIAFIKESRKIKESEFVKWFSLLDEVDHVYTEECRKPVNKLYVSGSQDYMFIDKLKKAIKSDEFARFIEIDGAGHVCNIDKSREFNDIMMDYLSENEEKDSPLLLKNQL